MTEIDVLIVACMQKRESNWRLRGGGESQERAQARKRRPVVHDAGEQKLDNAGVAAERAEYGNEASDLIGLEERSKVPEGSHENDTREAGVRFRKGRDMLHVSR